MCVAIVKLPHAALSEDTLRQGWVRNPDGGGFAYVEEGEVKVVKGFGTFKEFYEAYKQAAEEHKDSLFLVHFRIRSAGGKELDNTHPFTYEHGAIIHNGTIDGTGAKWSAGEPSDTAIFVKEMGKYLDPATVAEKREALSKALSYNKMAFLFKDNTYALLNEQDGMWVDGSWFSNGSCTVLANRHAL